MSDRRPGLKFLIFALICAVSAAWLIQVTGNFRFFASTNTYEAVMPDASGLNVSDSVHISGVRKGRVEGIELERGHAVVTFTLDTDVIPTDTWETGVRWRNVIGQRYLYLYPTGAGEPLDPGDRIPAERARPPADIALFFERITPLLRAIDPEQQNIVLAALNEAFAGKEERTQQLIADLGSLTTTLASREPEIRSVIEHGSAFLGAYAERDEQIRVFLDDFAAVSDTLAARNDELLGAVADIAEVQRQLADLLEANDADIRRLTDELDTMTASLMTDGFAVERALATAQDGLGVYMLISRWGQWFNIRAVAIQVHDDAGRVIYCQTEAGGTCAERNSGPQAPPNSDDSWRRGGETAQQGPPADDTEAQAAAARSRGIRRLAPAPVSALQAVTSAGLQGGGQDGRVADAGGDRG